MRQQPAADEVAAALGRVYARPEFTARESPLLLQLISDLWSAFRHWVGSLLRALLPDSLHPAVSWVLLGVLVLAALAAVIYLIDAAVGVRRQPRIAAQPAAGGAEDTRDAAQWEAAARAAAAEQRFRDAALALYMAAVLRLEERGVLRYHAAKTPGDYRREVRTHMTRAPFDRFVRAFLPVAFGARTPDRSSFMSLYTSAAELGVHE